MKHSFPDRLALALLAVLVSGNAFAQMTETPPTDVEPVLRRRRVGERILREGHSMIPRARLRGWLGLEEATFRDPAKVAILPMGFCFPGTGRSGDLPPRPECAPLWRRRVLAVLDDIRMTVVIGRYAPLWHLPETARLSLAEAMRDWRSRWPDSLLLPHPSPRTAGWFQRNAAHQPSVFGMVGA